MFGPRPEFRLDVSRFLAEVRALARLLDGSRQLEVEREGHLGRLILGQRRELRLDGAQQGGRLVAPGDPIAIAP